MEGPVQSEAATPKAASGNAGQKDQKPLKEQHQTQSVKPAIEANPPDTVIKPGSFSHNQIISFEVDGKVWNAAWHDKSKFGYYNVDADRYWGIKKDVSDNFDWLQPVAWSGDKGEVDAETLKKNHS